MFWRAWSLRGRLLALMMAGLVCLGVLAFFQVNRNLKSRQTLAKNEFRSKAMMVSNSIAAVFYERYMDIQAFATNSVFLSQNRDATIQTLNNYVENYKVYDLIMFVDAEGKFIAANSRSSDGKPLETKSFEGRSFAETPWFQRAFKNEFFEDKSKGLTGSVVEDVQIDPLSSALYGATQYGMSFSRSVVAPDGRVVGVVTARASVRFIESELRALYEVLQSMGYRSAQSLLVNRDGLLLSEVNNLTATERGDVRRNADRILRWNLATQQGQTAANDVLAGKSGALLEIDRNDRSERVWGYNPISDRRFLDQLGWSVVVSAHSDEVFADFLMQRRWFMFGLFVLLVVFSLFGYGMARNISREFQDYANKLKEESARLGEIGEGLETLIRKSSSSTAERSSTVGIVTSEADKILLQSKECNESLIATAQKARDVFERSTRIDHAVQRVAVEMTLARNSSEHFHQYDKSLQTISERLEVFADVIARAQLLGVNASIEASRSPAQGQGFQTVAQDIEIFAEQANTLIGELSDAVSHSRRLGSELSTSIRRSVSDGETLISEARTEVAQFPAEFSSMAQTIESIHDLLLTKEEGLRGVFEVLNQVESGSGQSPVIFRELTRDVQNLREQCERLEDVAQDLAASVRGQRPRVRGRRQSVEDFSSATVFRRGPDQSADQLRADVVDRLARKMRPRLVVKTDDSEPEVDPLADENAPRQAS